MLIFNLHCQSSSGNTNMLRKKKSQCKILIVPEEGWFGQPKYSTPSKKPLRFAGFFDSFIVFFSLSLDFNI